MLSSVVNTLIVSLVRQTNQGTKGQGHLLSWSGQLKKGKGLKAINLSTFGQKAQTEREFVDCWFGCWISKWVARIRNFILVCDYREVRKKLVWLLSHQVATGYKGRWLVVEASGWPTLNCGGRGWHKVPLSDIMSQGDDRPGLGSWARVTIEGTKS